MECPRLLVDKLAQDLRDGKNLSRIAVERLAKGMGCTDRREVKELAELAVVMVAREIAAQDSSIAEKFERLVALYKRQCILSFRNSQSILLQQYSTPAPLGYLMGVYCGIDKFIPGEKFAFEPSAGNGLLTIAANPSTVVVNEIDALRRENLKDQGFYQVYDKDASHPFSHFHRQFDAVITNPPFGKVEQSVSFGTFQLRSLEHIMALYALDCMKDGGRAAIIIGGHTSWDELGRVQAGRNRIFLNYLYAHYQVDDVINISGKALYSRQGTAFDVRIILIAGRKAMPQGAAPLFNSATDIEIDSFEDLFQRIMRYPNLHAQNSLAHLQVRARKLLSDLLGSENLGAPYVSASQACTVLDTQVPDGMAYETQSALERIRNEVGGDMDNFVRHRLGYETKEQLCQALAAEQVDAVGMVIYNIEARSQGTIIGDMTGVGKGRVAAAVIRYAVHQGVKPVFITEKANLFSDIYRDLVAIGSGHLRPFIVNARESKTDVKDEDGNIVHKALDLIDQQAVFESGKIPASFDFVLATYTQFNSKEKKPAKPIFLSQVAEDNIFILDEAHNSSGSSNTGNFLRGVVGKTRGVCFLSATFAKRPDNMPIYAEKTCIADCSMSREGLVEAIAAGGVALQEVLSAQLVAEGQMIRRERSFEGVVVNYITLTDMAQEHSAIADNITLILRDIITFQRDYIDPTVKDMDKIAVVEGKEIVGRQGTNKAGVDNQPYFSKIFNVINQMLFSLKAQAVAERAIMRLREGKKPVIAFASTMGAYIDDLVSEGAGGMDEGMVVDIDFSSVLQKGLDGVMRYTVRGVDGRPTYQTFSISELSPEGQAAYRDIAKRINAASTGLTISPIDVLVKIITGAGYKVAEVTGRKYEVQLNKDNTSGLVLSRKKINTNDAFRQFNNNEVDVLLINQSGSTGASAHAIATKRVRKEDVKQRVMIVLQAELDINTEVQKRGRINRTGQILKPEYDYLTSAIPAEMRLLMMLQKKLKSLDANTTSNQKQSTKILDVPDFLNKYGDKIVVDYLYENPEINNMLDDPLGLTGDSGKSSAEKAENAAHKVSGRVAVLSTDQQAQFYSEVSTRYNDYVEYLKQTGDYDLEVEAMALDAETINTRVAKMGKGTDSAFGADSIMETVKVNVLKKPFTIVELENILVEVTGGKEPKILQAELIRVFHEHCDARLTVDIASANLQFDKLLDGVQYEPKIKKLVDAAEKHSAIQERNKEIEQARRDKHALITKISTNRRNYLDDFFQFFYPGRALLYPAVSFENGTSNTPAVFIGFGIDFKKENPFIPSQVKLRFAVASSAKYIAIPASFTKDVSAVIGASARLAQLEHDEVMANWSSYTQDHNVDRQVRHIVTGNILQAFGTFRGKLVSFTTIDGGVKKGILLPENWAEKDSGASDVAVPISFALSHIASLVVGKQVVASDGVSIFRAREGFRVVVPAARSVGGDIYLDHDLLSLVAGGTFEKTSDKMIAHLPEDALPNFLQILQDAHGITVSIPAKYLAQVRTSIAQKPSRKPIALPPPELHLSVKDNDKVIQLFRLRARALQLALELAA